MESQPHNFILANGIVSGNSHSVAYSLTTYHMAYLKTHYPIEFYCSLLTQHTDDKDKLMQYLARCKAADIKVMPPNVNESDAWFTVVNNSIRFGLAGIRDIGEGLAKSIVKLASEKQFTDIEDLYDRCKGVGLNKRGLDALVKSGALDCFGVSRGSLLSFIEPIIKYGKDLEGYNKKYSTYLNKLDKYNQRESDREMARVEGRKVLASKTFPTEPSKPEKPVVQNIDISVSDMLAMEKEMLGYYVSGHPLYAYTKQISKTNCNTRALQEALPGEYVNLVCIITTVRSFVSKKGNNIAFVGIEDMYGCAELVMFAKAIGKYGKLLETGKVVMVSGHIDKEESTSKRIIVDKLSVVSDLKESSKKELSIQPKKKEYPKRGQLIISDISYYKVDKVLQILKDNPGNNIELLVSVDISTGRYNIDSGTISNRGWDQLELLDNIKLEVFERN